MVSPRQFPFRSPKFSTAWKEWVYEQYIRDPSTTPCVQPPPLPTQDETIWADWWFRLAQCAGLEQFVLDSYLGIDLDDWPGAGGGDPEPEFSDICWGGIVDFSQQTYIEDGDCHPDGTYYLGIPNQGFVLFLPTPFILTNSTEYASDYTAFDGWRWEFAGQSGVLYYCQGSSSWYLDSGGTSGQINMTSNLGSSSVNAISVIFNHSWSGTEQPFVLKENVAAHTVAVISTSVTAPTNGTSVTITGKGFEATQGAIKNTSNVSLTISSWSDTSITFISDGSWILKLETNSGNSTYFSLYDCAGS